MIDGKEAWNMLVVEAPKTIHLMERRHFTRINVDRHPVEITAIPGTDDKDSSSGNRYYGVLTNLSDSGLLLGMKNPLPVGTFFSLYWRTPSGAVELKGRCIRSDEEQGVEFPWRCAMELVAKDDPMTITGVFRAV